MEKIAKNKIKDHPQWDANIKKIFTVRIINELNNFCLNLKEIVKNLLIQERF